MFSGISGVHLINFSQFRLHDTGFWHLYCQCCLWNGEIKGVWPIMVAKRRLPTSHAFWTLTLEGETNPVDIFFRLEEATFRSNRNLLEK